MTGLPVMTQAVPRLDRAILLAVLLGVGMAFYLSIEPTQEWILLLLAGLAALGTDGVLRSHPASPFSRPDHTIAFLFLPALLTLGAGLFLEDVIDGYWSVGAGLITIPGFAAVLYGDRQSTRLNSSHIPLSRMPSSA